MKVLLVFGAHVDVYSALKALNKPTDFSFSSLVPSGRGGGQLIVRMYSLNKEFLTYFLEHIKKRLECEGDE